MVNVLSVTIHYTDLFICMIQGDSLWFKKAPYPKKQLNKESVFVLKYL